MATVKRLKRETDPYSSWGSKLVLRLQKTVEKALKNLERKLLAIHLSTRRMKSHAGDTCSLTLTAASFPIINKYTQLTLNQCLVEHNSRVFNYHK